MVHKQKVFTWLIVMMFVLSLGSFSAFAQDAGDDGDPPPAETGEGDDSSGDDDSADDGSEDADDGSDDADDSMEDDDASDEDPCDHGDEGEDGSDDAESEDGEGEEGEDDASDEESEGEDSADGDDDASDDDDADSEEGEETDEGDEDDTDPCADDEDDSADVPAEPVNPWYGQYWANPTFSGPPSHTRNDDFVNFDWGPSSPFSDTVGFDWFSARWTHTIAQPEQGFYQVEIASDYGARLDVNGVRILDTIRNGDGSPVYAYFWMMGDRNINLRYDYFHHEGYAIARANVTQMPVWSAPFGKGTIVNESVALRDGPGTEYYGNGRVDVGEVVTLTGHRNLPGNWVCVITEDGTVGWMNVYYLQTNYPIERLQVWPMWLANGEPTGRVNSSGDYINVRYDPAPSATVIAQANQGSNVVLVGRTDTNNWLLVRMWEGTLGWAPAGGIDTDYPIDNLPIRRFVSAETTPQ